MRFVGIRGKTMKYFPVLVGLLLPFSIAHASKWVVISPRGAPANETSEIVLQVDATSLREREGFRQAWVLYSYLTDQKINNSGTNYKSGMFSQIFDCKNAEYATQVAVYYSERFSQGKQISSDTVTRDQVKNAMQPVAPDTYGYLSLDWVCAQIVK